MKIIRLQVPAPRKYISLSTWLLGLKAMIFLLGAFHYLKKLKISSRPKKMKAAEPKANPKLVHRHWSCKFNRDQRVMQNFRSLFAPYNFAGVSCAKPPSAKKSRVSFQVKETWTNEFVCLGSTTATCVPSRAQKIALQNAGLGRRKVLFHCKASSIDVKTKLESVYPKLIQGVVSRF